VLLVDQLSKSWAVANLTGQPPYEVLGRFLMFSLVYNEGGAMGTRIGPSLYYLIMALIVLPFLLYYIYHNRLAPMVSLPLSFIAAGAIGNLIDRVLLGKVVDFIDVDFFDIDLFGFQMTRFWTFNVADSAISCAIVFLVGLMILHRHALDPHPTEPPASTAPPPDETGG
jgi:signal peptidase II